METRLHILLTLLLILQNVHFLILLFNDYYPASSSLAHVYWKPNEAGFKKTMFRTCKTSYTMTTTKERATFCLQYAIEFKINNIKIAIKCILIRARAAVTVKLQSLQDLIKSGIAFLLMWPLSDSLIRSVLVIL